jgi:hypothetical protein
MTTPDLSGVIPLKWKTWVAAISGVLAIAVPYILQLVVYLPDPWPTVVGGVIAILGVFGVYRAPYVPPNASVVPDTQIAAPPPPEGGYRNPWQQ